MRLSHLDILVCPQSKRPLILKQGAVLDGERIKEGILLEPVTGKSYPITNFIPRFVSQDNYARSFGVQWTIHNRTQYDAHSGFALSRKRFESETRWTKDLRGEVILEVGSGAGRFTTHALETGATVVSFDYSGAVDANLRSNGDKANLLLVQASVYEMPFRLDFFDKVFSFGVLQHTPDPRAALFAIVQHLKPGGRLAADIYAKTVRNWLLNTKYWVRPFIDRRNPQVLYGRLKRYIDFMWPLARLLRRVPRIGHTLNWRLLIADYSGMLPGADDATLKGWAYLDTFDILAPAHDHPATLKRLRRWYQEAGLVEIDVHYGHNGIEGRGRKPPSVETRPLKDASV